MEEGKYMKAISIPQRSDLNVLQITKA